MNDPSKLAATRRVVAYLKATQKLGVSVKRRIDELNDAVRAHCEAK